MKIVSHAKRCGLVPARPPKKSYQVTKTEYGGFILTDYEPLDPDTNHAETYELSTNLKTGYNLDPVPPLDLLSFQDKINSVESRLVELSNHFKQSQSQQNVDQTPKSE